MSEVEASEVVHLLLVTCRSQYVLCPPLLLLLPLVQIAAVKGMRLLHGPTHMRVVVTTGMVRDSELLSLSTSTPAPTHTF